MEDESTMPCAYQIIRVVPASPKRLFEAWLDSREHSDMTGRKAAVGPCAGDAVSLLDGLITGANVCVEPNRRLAQRWSIDEPGLGVTESLVEMELVAGRRFGGIGSPFEGTTLVLRHSGLPAEQTTFDVDWWEESYFAPMDAYFGQGDNRWTRPGAVQPR